MLAMDFDRSYQLWFGGKVFTPGCARRSNLYYDGESLFVMVEKVLLQVCIVTSAVLLPLERFYRRVLCSSVGFRLDPGSLVIWTFSCGIFPNELRTRRAG